ncbi:apolipoprotein N-acyltransferase [Nocardia cyriacigeorgica]|uniref:apolipoprotein N-acyltransferase n=1 Tax=Nocardia cyriacigeorgica TaxID=135487 RepID=UPI0018950B18|nr:apolipoprotein N-acyltransferase [Nocardia cyriacigeorgica]MBF6286380.1 apolipoprotein N-acyltransferase [Nocardia cyriacigeorgica]
MAAESAGFWSRPVAVLNRHPVLVRAAGAIVAGLLLFGSFPPRPWWFLAPVGIALLTLVVRGAVRLRGGFGYGLLAGLGFFLPLLPWTGIYVGPVPWLALSAACAVYVGLFGAMARLLATLPGWPLWIALAWTTAEWGRSSFPFGGFPWGRLAFGQADGWFLPLAAYGGAPLVGFAVALTGTGIAALVVAVRGGQKVVCEPAENAVAADDAHDAAEAAGTGPTRRVVAEPTPGSRRRAGLAAVLVIAVMPVAGLALRPTLPGPDDGYASVTVAAIQGSVPRLGLDFNAQRRAVLDNHARRTEQLADDIAAGRAPQPDLVIWPENSSDIDPLRNADAASIVTRAARRVGAPILIGAVLVNDDRTTTNSMMVWTEESGPAERHDKRIIQPFGEYLPMRGFFRLFSEYADRAGYFVPGDGDGTVRIDGVDLGVATCYEVAFDRAFRDSMAAGAQLLTVPTNNATFGDSEMTYQQLAMSRVRAVEHGRALVVAATTGVSAMITADGAVRQQTELFVPAALVAQLPLRDSTTLATRLGAAPEWLAIILTAGALAVAAIRRRTRPRNEPTGRASSPEFPAHPSAL